MSQRYVQPQSPTVTVTRSHFKSILNTYGEGLTDAYHEELNSHYISEMEKLEEVHAQELAAQEKRIAKIRAHHACEMDNLRKEHDAEVDLVIIEYREIADQLWREHQMMLPALKTKNKAFEGVVWCAQTAGEMVTGVKKIKEAVRNIREVYEKKGKEAKRLEEARFRDKVSLEKER